MTDTATPPSPAVEDVPSAAVTVAGSPVPAATKGPASAAVVMLKQALAKVESQRTLIGDLTRSKRESDDALAAAASRIAELQQELEQHRRDARATQRLAVQAEAVLGLNAGAAQAVAASARPLSAMERTQRIREAARPVVEFRVRCVGSSGSDAVASKNAQRTSANDEEDDCDGPEREQLTAQIDQLESELKRSHENCMKLQDIVDRQHQQDSRPAESEGARSLAEELARVQEVLSESTATWDAKQQELQRLRTLMRFSVLKKESDQLQDTLERCDQLEVTASQERRKAREKQYEVERLERQLERALADARVRKTASAELKRLRLLESHCLAIMSAQDRDPVYASAPGASRNAAAAALVGASGRPTSATATRPTSASRGGPAPAPSAQPGSPRTGVSAPKPLRTLLPAHLLRGMTKNDAANPRVELHQAPVDERQVARGATPDTTSVAPAGAPAAQSATQHPTDPKTATPAQSTKEAAAPVPAPPAKPAEPVVPSSSSAALKAAPAVGRSGSVSAPTSAPKPERQQEEKASAPSTPRGGEGGGSPTKPTPMTPAEDDGTAPITTDTPFSVIASRMAKYLAKREDERKEKKERAEAEAKAEMDRRAREDREKRSRLSSTGSLLRGMGGHHRPYSAGTRSSSSGSGSVAALRRTASSGGYSGPAAAAAAAAVSLPSERVYDSVLKRQYEELKARVDATSGGTSQRSPRGGSTSHRGSLRPSSASRRPLSAHFRR
jgi:hypothetical protein